LGDPTEGALLVLAGKAKFKLEAALQQEQRVYMLPFDSRRKRMSSLHQQNGRVIAYVKGAPREVLSLCTSQRSLQGVERPLDEGVREEIMARNDAMAKQGLRVLAMADRALPDVLKKYTSDSVEVDLIFLGLVGMMDPPRPEVVAAVQKARDAGVNIIMVTGDYGLTAEAIAESIGITGGAQARIITGAELEKMDDGQLKEALEIKQPLIFARVAPEHKMRVVAGLQELGQVVAMLLP
jgi:P-type E1-E2 ATPase